jgi:lysozyme
MNADDDLLLASIKRHEGFRSIPYVCPEGFLSVGYGHNLDSGMSVEEASCLLKIRLAAVLRQLRQYVWFDFLSAQRQRSLAEMGFQLGIAGLRRFQKMLSALARDDFQTAAEEMLDSKWAKQTPTRAEHCAEMMRRG